MAEQQSVITKEMRDQIGKEGPPSTLEVDKTAVRMFARAVGHTDQVFYDEEEAKRRGYRSLPAPPGYLGTRVYNPKAAQGDGPGSFTRGPYKRILNGGTEIEYLGDICAGDVLTARSKIADLSERQGSVGPMLITVSETSYTNQDGKLVAISRGTIISY
ncbi:MAG TPA: MaoC family dehydratase N-terminal domain-containing protein [Dehalococcoidia bacterium]|nr:MaoC family dehydratase N-terminal domain-containing protein [Dehalococcoidia bacterium]